MNITYSSNCLTFVCNHLNYSDFAEKLLFTEVTINSNNIIKKFKALLDTGSELLLLSRKKVDEYNIHLNYSNIRIDSLGGVSNSFGVTDLE
jgi:hypothetical protein